MNNVSFDWTSHVSALLDRYDVEAALLWGEAVDLTISAPVDVTMMDRKLRHAIREERNRLLRRARRNRIAQKEAFLRS